MEAWIVNGAQLAWLIDPYEATVTIHLSQSPNRGAETARVYGGRSTGGRLPPDHLQPVGAAALLPIKR